MLDTDRASSPDGAHAAAPPPDGASSRPTGEPGEQQADERGAPPVPLLDAVLGMVRELPSLVGDRIELLSLELRRAGIALAQIAALVVASAILAVTAWLAIWGGIVVGLVEVGLHWSLALLAVVLLNLGAVALAWRRMLKLSPALRLPATRRHLGFTPSPVPRDPPARDQDAST